MPRLSALTLATLAFIAPAVAVAATKDDRAASGKGSVTVPSQPTSSRYFGLNRLWLAFGNGDHKLKSIGALLGANTTTATLADNDGNDPFRYSSTNYVLPAGTTMYETVKTDCRGRCKVAVANGGANQEFVLVGFSLKRDKDDSNVRVVAIEPAVGTGYVWVEFADNGVFDYDVHLQYAYVFKSQLVDGKAYELSGRRTHGEEELRLGGSCGGGIGILSGFRFQFDNGDHHLRELRIALDHLGASVRYNDANFDDPYTAKIRGMSMKL